MKHSNPNNEFVSTPLDPGVRRVMSAASAIDVAIIAGASLQQVRAAADTLDIEPLAMIPVYALTQVEELIGIAEAIAKNGEG